MGRFSVGSYVKSDSTSPFSLFDNFWGAYKSIERDVCSKLTNNISVFLLSAGNMNGSLGNEKCCEHKPQLVN